MRLSVAEVRNLHPTCRPDRLLTAAGSARGVQRRAEVPGFRQRRAEVPAGRPEKPALSIREHKCTNETPVVSYAHTTTCHS